MKFKYADDAVKYEYEVKYLDKNDDVFTTYLTGYSEKQIEFYMKKHHPLNKVIEINQLREIPSGNGKQIEMDFGD
jgi:predicted secreted protein